jgi:hypothetical protein
MLTTFGVGTPDGGAESGHGHGGVRASGVRKRYRKYCVAMCERKINRKGSLSAFIHCPTGSAQSEHERKFQACRRDSSFG